MLVQSCIIQQNLSFTCNTVIQLSFHLFLSSLVGCSMSWFGLIDWLIDWLIWLIGRLIDDVNLRSSIDLVWSIVTNGCQSSSLFVYLHNIECFFSTYPADYLLFSVTFSFSPRQKTTFRGWLGWTTPVLLCQLEITSSPFMFAGCFIWKQIYSAVLIWLASEVGLGFKYHCAILSLYLWVQFSVSCLIVSLFGELFFV